MSIFINVIIFLENYQCYYTLKLMLIIIYFLFALNVWRLPLNSQSIATTNYSSSYSSLCAVNASKKFGILLK
jgi:hypothetical protein